MAHAHGINIQGEQRPGECTGAETGEAGRQRGSPCICCVLGRAGTQANGYNQCAVLGGGTGSLAPPNERVTREFLRNSDRFLSRFRLRRRHIRTATQQQQHMSAASTTRASPPYPDTSPNASSRRMPAGPLAFDASVGSAGGGANGGAFAGGGDGADDGGDDGGDGGGEAHAPDRCTTPVRPSLMLLPVATPKTPSHSRPTS